MEKKDLRCDINRIHLNNETERQIGVLNSLLKQKSFDLRLLKSKFKINLDAMDSLNLSLRFKDEEINNLKRNICEIKDNVRKLGFKTKICESKMRRRSSVLLNDKSLPNIDTVDENNRKVITLIFSYLDTCSLISASQVCRLWQECSLNPKLWRNVVISRSEVSNDLLVRISQFCSKTNAIILKNLKPKSCKNRETFECNVEMGLELILLSAAKFLKTFAVIDCDMLFTNRVAWLVSNHCPHLVNFIYISNKDSINSEMVWSLGAGCRKVKSLIIPPIMPMKTKCQLTNRCLQSVGTVFPYLNVLCIGGHQIDKRGLINIAYNCRQLHTLELDHMGEVREKTAIEMCQNGLNNLNNFYLTFTAISPKAILRFFKNCAKLQNMIIQLNFFVYFKMISQENLKKYRETVKCIEALTKTPQLYKVLHLKTDLNERNYSCVNKSFFL